ncbi:MAG TPA: DUF4189 domain-containing protein [Solirubrobacterales bacterium]|nr:DUF4189 domain-containing protein [Solirubrobacterales bacterium]
MRRQLLVLFTAFALLGAAPAAAEADWGAIAVDPETGRYGVSYEYNSVAAAKNRAKNECGSRHCKVAAWVSNGFAALVRKKNGVYYAGIGRTENLARKNARRNAHDSGARYITSVFSGYS